MSDATKKANWDEFAETEFAASPKTGEDPWEWFKHSGFFKAYLGLYDKNGDGKATTEEMKCALDGCVKHVEMEL